MMVTRIYCEKKEGFRQEAEALRKDLEETLSLKVKQIRIINRYDVEAISDETLEKAKKEVFSEPQVDNILSSLPTADQVFSVCYLPGQFDQRATSAKECIAFIAPNEDVKVKSGKVYLLDGVSDAERERIEEYVINPVEAMRDTLDLPHTLTMEAIPPESVKTLQGFTAMDDDSLGQVITTYALAMDRDDLKVFQDYFKSERREPTITELKVCDTYWSDHCRHTTFLTALEKVTIHDEKAKKTYNRYQEIRRELGRTKPESLMDVATIGAKYLMSKGLLPELDVSEEINACSVHKINHVDGKEIPTLLMFKNETHNHPTEIEPFGGAATCIGGAIRDPLSGRAYVYQALRISGAGDPTRPFADTIPGKLPQKKLVVTASNGNSSYGNQIGLATGLVDEVYHPGYIAKHMELGAVVAAVPEENVRREEPRPGDVVILLGGRTGRDGIGGATGSSKRHKASSLSTCAAEVQKGNAPEERKIQRLFRDKETARMIKRCNDFGAGGVSVAIGELADGLSINLDAVPRKYAGLDGTETAISESQERMAIVVEDKDAKAFLKKAEGENLEATIVAVVTAEPVLEMHFQGKTIARLSRAFLSLNGAAKHADAEIEKPGEWKLPYLSIEKALQDLNITSKQGLSERFDSTIGAGSVLMPFGGKTQKTPSLVATALLPSEKGRSNTASVMSYAFNPYAENAAPYEGAYEAVMESVAKLIASGATLEGTYLTLQEYFGSTGTDPKRWGRPLAALLGALQAQLDLGIAAIGGKDSMSGTFEHIDVPNTLVSFAINTVPFDQVISPEFKKEGSIITLVTPEGEDMKEYFRSVEKVIRTHQVLSASTVPFTHLDAQLAKCCFGNMIGIRTVKRPETVPPGSFILESDKMLPIGYAIGVTNSDPYFNATPLKVLLKQFEKTLKGVYPLVADTPAKKVETISIAKGTYAYSGAKIAKPRVLIPVFPGTNCEYDSQKAFEEAGAECQTFIINTLSSAHIEESIKDFASAVKNAQILFIPGGFSGGDEPDGSGKFITSFLRNTSIQDSIMEMLKTRACLVGGICNGFQALIKLGLVPYGEFRTMDENCPTLTFNTIGRHISHLANTRISSNASPWLSGYEIGDEQMVPVSHGEGRFIITPELLETLRENGQIATQYVDADGKATMDSHYNLNGSCGAVEGITSPDGHVFGRMGHIERCNERLYRNVNQSSSLRFFKGATGYFA